MQVAAKHPWAICLRQFPQIHWLKLYCAWRWAGFLDPPAGDQPSAMLRAAEAEAMALDTRHQQPAALVVALDRLGLPNTEVAGLPLPRFLEILSSLKIVVDGGSAELQEDLDNARLWLNGAPCAATE